MKALGIYLILFVVGTIIYSCATSGPDPMSYAAASPETKRCIDTRLDMKSAACVEWLRGVREKALSEQEKWKREIREGHKAKAKE